MKLRTRNKNVANIIVEEHFYKLVNLNIVHSEKSQKFKKTSGKDITSGEKVYGR